MSSTTYKNLQVLLSANVSSFQGSMYTASKAVQALNSDLKATNAASVTGAKGLDGMAKSTESAAKSSILLKTGLAAFGIAAVAGLYEGAKAAIEFDKNMRNVTSLITGAGGSAAEAQQQFVQMSKGVLEISKSLPQSADQLSKGLYDVISAGVPAADALRVLQVAGAAASAGLSDTATSVQAITGIMNAYGYSANQATAISDVLFQTVNVGVVTFPQLAQGIGEVVAIAAAAKVPITEVGTAIATVTRAGLQPAEAFTGLTRAIQQIVNPGKELSQVFQNLGFNSGEAALQSLGLKGVIDAIQKQTGGDIVGVDKLFSDIRAQKTVVDLMAQSGQLYNTVAESMTHNNAYLGATFRALQEQQKSVSFQFDLLKNKVEASAIAFGQKMNPALAGLLGTLGRDSTTGFTNLGNAVKSVEPQFRTLGRSIADVSRFVADLTKDLAPVAAAFAGLGLVLVIDTLTGLARILSPIVNLLDRNRVAVEALGAVLVGRYLIQAGLATVATFAFNTALEAEALAADLAAASTSRIGFGAVLARTGLLTASTGALGLASGLSAASAAALPLGVALGAGAGIYLSYRETVKETAAEVKSFTKAIADEKDGLTGEVDALVAAQLAHSVYQSALRGLNLSNSDVTAAIRGSTAEQGAFIDALERTDPTVRKSAKAQAAISEAFQGSKRAAGDFSSALVGANGQLTPQQVKTAQLVAQIAALSQTYGQATTKADGQKSSLEQLLNVMGGPGSVDPLLLAGGIKQIGDSSQVSDDAMQALKKDTEALQSEFAKWASPSTAFSDAMKDAQAAAAASTKSTKEDLQGQKQAYDDSIESQITAARQSKTEVTNSSKGATSAISKNISDLQAQKKAQDEDLQNQIKHSQGVNTANKSMADSAKVTLDSFLSKLKAEDDALEQFQKNLVTIAGKFGQPIADQLGKLGPTAAALIQEMANATGPRLDALKEELERNLNLGGLAPNIEQSMGVAASAAGKGADLIGTAAIAGLKGNLDALKAIAKEYAIDLTTLANPILDALGLKKVDVQSIYQGPFLDPHKQVVVQKADGGVENHSAEIAPGGAWRLWAEPETGGEAYIPLANTKAQRSEQIWKQVGKIKGWSFAPVDMYANGGVNGLPLPPKFPGYPLAQQYQKVTNGMYLALQNAIGARQGAGGGAGGSAGAAPAGTVTDWIHQAEQIAGWPDSYTNGIYQLIMHESGGNPNAINLTDSNAKAGHPSQGLTQTIPSTFNAYAFPGHGSITNPIDNILAGISYALKNYGPGMVTAGGRHTSSGAYLGYRDGGFYQATYDQGGALRPGYTLAYNGTGKTEHVMTENQINRIVTAIETNKGGNQIIVNGADRPVETGREVRRALA